MKRIILLLLIFTFLPLAKAGAISEKLTVDMHYIVINPADEGSIQIKHMVNYTNISDEELSSSPETGAVLSIQLPSGAMNLQVHDESLGVKLTETGFSTSKPIAAKDTQVIPYSYSMPGGVPAVFKLDYPLQVMQVLIPEGAGSVLIEGAKNSNAGLMQFEEKNFWLYNVEGIEKDQEIKLIYDKNKQPSQEEAAAGKDGPAATDSGDESVSNVTRTSPQFHNPGHVRLWNQSSLKTFNPHILLIVLGTILTAGLGYYSYFKWKARLQEIKVGADQEEQQFQQLIARKNAILQKILELEDAFAEGQLLEEEYLVKLNAYKQHLVKVNLNLRNFME